MSRLRLQVPGLALAAALAAATPALAQSGAVPSAASHQPIRTTDFRLHHLIDEGRDSSPTFRHLLDRLWRSDVIVFLECSGPESEGGRLTFMTAAGGFRFVRVRVARVGSSARQIALLAHELRHAIEIADEPAVVDEASLVAAYRRLGYARDSTRGRLAFDTEAAVEAGYQVLRELLDRRRSGSGPGVQRMYRDRSSLPTMSASIRST